MKFADQYIGANTIAGKHTPGIFTNQMHTLFSEPMLLILTDPRTDHPGNSIFELMSFFPYTTDSFVLTWILCVPVCCRPLRKVDTFLFLVM